MKKSRVRLALQKKKDAEKIELGESTHDKILANALVFINPLPLLLDYKAAYLAYRVAYENALLGGKPLKAILKLKREAFVQLLKQMAFYVNNVANGDGAIITLAGFDINSEPISRIMTQVTGVQVFPGLHSGEISLEWDLITGARLYLGYIREAGIMGSKWDLVMKAGGSRGVVNGLIPGGLYEVAIEACGSGLNNVGKLSDVVQVRATF
jgi:hypothetical protein